MEPEPSSSSSSSQFIDENDSDQEIDASFIPNGAQGISSSTVMLYQFSGNSKWRLPSIDPQCLRVQAYFKFCGIAFKINNCNNPNMSPSKTLPVVAFDAGTVVAEPVEIIKYTNKMGYDLDRHLLPSQLADLRAFQALVEDSLDDIHMYHLWMEQKNVETVTQSLYATRLPFPANWWVPKMMKRNIQTRLATRLPSDADKVYAKAEEIYIALSRKLGSNDYFFGTSPTTFDALAFGYLMTHLTLELPEQKLKALAASHDNLKAFCDRILTKFFNEEPLYINQEPLRQFLERKNKRKAPKEETDDEKTYKRHSAYAVMFGLVSLVVFGLLHNQPVRHMVRQAMNGRDSLGEDEDGDFEDSNVDEDEVVEFDTDQ